MCKPSDHVTTSQEDCDRSGRIHVSDHSEAKKKSKEFFFHTVFKTILLEAEFF